MKNFVVITFLLLVYYLPSTAAEWDGSAELGFVSTAGNSDSETLNAGLKLTSKWSDWENTAVFSYLSSSQSQTTSAERFLLTNSIAYNINSRSFTSIYASYEDDRFSGFDSQLASTANYGYRVLIGEPYQLEIKAGLGYRLNEFSNDATPEESYLIFRFAEKFDWGAI